MMDVYNFDLKQVLKNLKDYLDGKMANLEDFNYFVLKPDENNNDQVNKPLTEIEQYVVPNDSGDGSDQFGQYESSSSDLVGTPLHDYELFPCNTGYHPDSCGFYLDSSGLFIPDNGGFYGENVGFYVDGLFYPNNSGVYYTDNNGQYLDNSGCCWYFSTESQSTGGVSAQPAKKKTTKAIDIINPETGEKLQFC